MAFTDLITIGTTNFDLRSKNGSRSVRADGTAPLGTDDLLTISHETNKQGLVSSAVFRDNVVPTPCETTCGAGSANVRALFKVQYNPTLGITDLEVEVAAVIADLVAFLGTQANVDKLLNQES